MFPIQDYPRIQEYLTEEVLGQSESTSSDKVARKKVARDKLARKLEENMGLVEGLREARELVSGQLSVKGYSPSCLTYPV